MKPKLASAALCLSTTMFILVLSSWTGASVFAAQPKSATSPSPSDALFDPGRVIQIEIRLDPKDWRALRISHPVVDQNGGISITEKGYEYHRADVIIDGREIESVGVRKKGSWGSTVSARPSLKIKFDEFVKNQELSGLDMMTLNNCLNDPTKAQQFIAYEFMTRAGVPAPRSNLARVRVNGEDLGIYAHVESIRKPFIKRFFSNANGDLYENVTRADLTTNLVNRLVHKWGKDKDRTHLDRLVDALEAPGPVSIDRIAILVDLDAFIRFWVAEVLIGHVDGYPAMFNNFYIYRDGDSSKFHFIPAGEDSDFSDRTYYGTKTTPKSVKAAGFLCERLWEVPGVKELYRKEMRRQLNEVWDEKAMLSELDRIRTLCNGGDPDYKPARVKESVGRIVRFIEERRQDLQLELEGPFPVWTPIPRRSEKSAANTNAPMHVEGSFSAVMAERFPTNLLNHGSGDLRSTVKGKSYTPFTRFGAAAVPKFEVPFDIESFTEMSVIWMEAADDSGDLRWRLVFRIDPYRLTTSVVETYPFCFLARILQWKSKSPESQEKGFSEVKGTLELTQVSTNIGGTISGKFKINTTAFGEEKP